MCGQNVAQNGLVHDKTKYANQIRYSRHTRWSATKRWWKKIVFICLQLFALWTSSALRRLPSECESDSVPRYVHQLSWHILCALSLALCVCACHSGWLSLPCFTIPRVHSHHSPFGRGHMHIIQCVCVWYCATKNGMNRGTKYLTQESRMALAFVVVQWMKWMWHITIWNNYELLPLFKRTRKDDREKRQQQRMMRKKTENYVNSLRCKWEQCLSVRFVFGVESFFGCRDIYTVEKSHLILILIKS